MLNYANRSLELRSSLLTLGRVDASITLPSLNRSLDLRHVAARDGKLKMGQKNEKKATLEV